MNYSKYKDKIFTIPNALSMLRILLLPVFANSYMNAKTSKDYLIAALVLIISSLTDMIDGKIARRFNMISDLGKLLDPVADKATHLVIAICLCTHFTGMKSLVVLLFVKEGCMFLFCLYGYFKGHIWDSAQWYGKVSTAIVFTSFVLLALFPGMPGWLSGFLIGLCFFILAFSLIMYAREFFFLNRKSEKNAERREHVQAASKENCSDK